MLFTGQCQGKLMYNKYNCISYFLVIFFIFIINVINTLSFTFKVGKVNATDTYELTSVCAALCNTRNLRDVIHYIIPPTQACIALRKPEAKILTPDSLGKSATVPRSSHSKAPPIPPRNKEPKNKVTIV